MMSITRQCEVLSLNRSSLYVKNRGETALNLKLMELMDVHYLSHPYKGARRMHVWLTKDMGYEVSLNRVERLYYKVMGLRAIIPGPHTSKRCKDHAVYPYLLRDRKANEPNEVWATDITYIGIQRGYLYLTAIIDLYSRFVVGWSLSNTMDAPWCVEILQSAIEEHGCPQIINTDQGSQYTSNEFTGYVEGQNGLQLSMDGKGRATDNAFIERLWRSVKYEKIHLYKPQDGLELYLLLEEYFQYYNNQRRHSSIDDKHPVELYKPCSKVSREQSSFPHSNTLQKSLEGAFWEH